MKRRTGKHEREERGKRRRRNRSNRSWRKRQRRRTSRTTHRGRRPLVLQPLYLTHLLAFHCRRHARLGSVCVQRGKGGSDVCVLGWCGAGEGRPRGRGVAVVGSVIRFNQGKSNFPARHEKDIITMRKLNFKGKDGRVRMSEGGRHIRIHSFIFILFV